MQLRRSDVYISFNNTCITETELIYHNQQMNIGFVWKFIFVCSIVLRNSSLKQYYFCHLWWELKYFVFTYFILL